MDDLFLVIALLSIPCMIVGLISPTLVIRWGDPEKRTRKAAFLIYFSVMVISFIAFGMTTDKSNTQTTSTQQASSVSSTSQEKAPSPKPTEEKKPTVKSYSSGHYKVGSDLPAGEYVLITQRSIPAYFEVTSDAKGNLESIISNDNFTNRSIITVENGQYIKTQGCSMYAFNDAPKADSKGGFLPAGMYKVGVDIPAGEYKIQAEGQAYVEVSNNSAHTLDGIVSNDNFTGERYIDIANGQYIKINNAKIKL